MKDASCLNRQVRQMIYADNAATTELDIDAFEAMKPYLMKQYGNASQAYLFAKPAKKALSEAREIIAACIGARPEEIYFTSGGTESDNWAVKSILFMSKDRQRVVTSQIEHHAILNACNSLEKLGIPVDYLPVDSRGVLQSNILQDRICKDEDTGLVSIMLANNEIGTIEPIKDLCEIAHAKGALFHTGAVQAVGHIPINVKSLGVDMLSASAHKFNGMKGSGFLYVRNGVNIHSFLDGGAQEHEKRAGTENVAAIVAMAVALKKNCDKMLSSSEKLKRIENLFIRTLTNGNVDYIRNGATNHLPGNVNISIHGVDGELLLHRLDLKGICISTGSACDSVNTQVSHVVKAIKVPAAYSKGTIRITFGTNNTEAEAVEIAQSLIQILEK